jgi:hypothetical protein
LAQGIDDVLSYVMFPQPAKEYLEWRAAGGGVEREMVAAIVGALVLGEKRAQAAPAVVAAAPSSENGGGAWKQFGRMRVMR